VEGGDTRSRRSGGLIASNASHLRSPLSLFTMVCLGNSNSWPCNARSSYAKICMQLRNHADQTTRSYPLIVSSAGLYSDRPFDLLKMVATKLLFFLAFFGPALRGAVFLSTNVSSDSIFGGKTGDAGMVDRFSSALAGGVSSAVVTWTPVGGRKLDNDCLR
jgi:hypothetical protein